ncbi:MAG TPA: hypothetical protein GX530_03105 [Corynebacteriales bacterium]|nr:hypothetical protein [Mycobacteriales bacterium]
MSLVRKNWAAGDDYKTYEDGYPPALRFLFSKSRSVDYRIFYPLLNTTLNDWSVVLDAQEEEYWTKKSNDRRFVFCAFIRPGGWVTLCKDGDMSKNSLKIEVTDTKLKVTAITDTELTAYSETAIPEGFLPRCREKWFLMSVQIARRGSNIEMYVETEAGSDRVNTGKLLGKGTINPYGCTATGHYAHCAAIAAFYNSSKFHWFPYTGVVTDQDRSDGEEKAYSTIFPNLSHDMQSVRNICQQNRVFELIYSEGDTGRYNYRHEGKNAFGQPIYRQVVPDYQFYGEKLSWKAPDKARRITGVFVSHGGWGTPARKGITAVSDKDGMDGVDGRIYTSAIVERECTFVVPTVCGVRPHPPQVDGEWVWNPPIGGTHFPDRYESPPGCEYQPTFSPTWFPYIEERGQPQSIGEELYSATINAPGYVNQDDLIKQMNMRVWGIFLDTPRQNKYWDFCQSKEFLPYNLRETRRIKNATAGAGVRGFRGRRHTYSDGGELVTQTFLPVPPGKGCVWLEYVF